MSDTDAIDALLPQTQCTRCGYPACRPYAEAIADGTADLNRCPPGGAVTITALAALLDREPLPLDTDCGAELPVATVARVIEADCIGCTKCIQACPVDAIVGAANLMHVVITAECTGCELCLPPCPVDCIVMVEAPALALPRTRASEHRLHYLAREARLQRWDAEEREQRRRHVAMDPVAAALERVRIPLAIGNLSCMNPQKRREIYMRLRAANPAPTTELHYTTPFELLVAVVLSAQATDIGVNKATARLYPVANTPQAILDLGLDGLKQHIKTIGLFNAKAKNVIALCEILLRDHGGEVPREREALEALPGVGRKTANVVLNTAFGEHTIAVDTHIFRIANRTGLAPGKTVRAVEDKLVKVTPYEFARDAHHWLILHGRYVCKARKPECARCSLVDLCEFKQKTMPIAPVE